MAQEREVRVAAFAELDAATLYDLLRLRVDIFVVEQRCPYPELDGRDLEPSTRHVWVEETTRRPVGYLRLTSSPGRPRISRVCVAATHRGTGVADQLMRAALDVVGGAECELAAQTYLAGWYRRWGFAVAGAEYVEDGIAHVPMRRAGAG